MHIRLSDYFTHQNLLRFTALSVVMMIFISFYSVVDGLVVSDFVGKTRGKEIGSGTRVCSPC